MYWKGAVSGDLLDLHVALAPCIIGYAEIGSYFKDQVINTLLVLGSKCMLRMNIKN